MREAAERRQQLELEHEQALAILNAKQQEIDLLQKVSWAGAGGLGGGWQCQGPRAWVAGCSPEPFLTRSGMTSSWCGKIPRVL